MKSHNLHLMTLETRSLLGGENNPQSVNQSQETIPTPFNIPSILILTGIVIFEIWA